MTIQVLLLVLFGAALHATWNAMLKAGGDKLLDSALLMATSSLIGLPFLLLLPVPDPAAWPFLLGSTAIHQVYFWLVGATYRRGDLSYSYPLMRGLAPLIVALASGSLINEALSLQAWVGIGLICGGILCIAIGGLFRDHASPEPAFYAMANAVVIAVYTLVDGIGVRLSGSAVSYVMWLFVLMAVPYCGATISMRGSEFRLHVAKYWKRGAIGGLCSMGSYGSVLWAMTMAPVAPVAALRETSIVFATLLGGFVLKEKIGPMRYAAAAAAAAGAIALKLA